MTEPLLSVRNLSVAFHQGGRTTTAVDGISFDIRKGEVLALVGESARQVGLGQFDIALAALPVGKPPLRRDPVQGHGPFESHG